MVAGRRRLEPDAALAVSELTARGESTGSRWRRYGIVWGLWTLVSVVSLEQTLIIFRAKSWPSPWYLIARPIFVDNYLWALLTPLMVWCARRYPIDGSNWRRRMPLHVLFALGFHVIDIAFSIATRHWVDPTDTQTIWLMFVRRFFLNVFAYAAVVAIALAAAYARVARDRAVEAAQLGEQLAAAQLSALRAQLHPHFLFNTLNTIAEQLHTDPDGADRMIGRLSALLRRTLAVNGTQEVSLAEELDFLKAYLDIVETRFGDRVTVSLEIDPDALTAQVPVLILQPLVENAFQHGIEPMDAPGRLEISARRRADLLELEVRDNGQGLGTGDDSGDGVGLRNTRDRLRQLYGDEQELALRARVNGGTIAAISLPFHAAPLVGAV